jgi:hypothetical protein
MPGRMPRVDVLLVSLGGTAGLREADALLAGSLSRAGAGVELVPVPRSRELRTMALHELGWAVQARRATAAALSVMSPAAVLYSSVTAALLGPVPGAIRFDAPAAGNRPRRHGLWQRPVERRRFASASLLVPWSAGGLAEAPPAPSAEAVVVPVPVSPSGSVDRRDIAAITYAANPWKKGLDVVLSAWAGAARAGEELVVAGLGEEEGVGWLRRVGVEAAAPASPSALPGAAIPLPGGGTVRFVGMVARDEYRALLRRARLFLNAARREDYGIAQLEALADGCLLVTTPSPGPYAALPLARALDPRLVGPQLAIRTALDDPLPDYAERAAAAVAPWSPEAVDRVVAEQLLPKLLELGTEK